MKILPTAHRPPPNAYTLVEILVATVLTLLLMGVVVQLFGSLGQSITDSRAILEASERLNSAAARLQMDLKGVTVTMLPPRNPDDGEGYFEYIEGPIMQGFDWSTNPPPPNDIKPKPVNSDNGNTLDTTIGDFDDILMFTTRSTGKPFVGIFNYGTAAAPDIRAVQSDVAEVAWFIRGRTLYRRQLLVAPALMPSPIPINPAAVGFYAYNDLSVRIENGQFLANTLSDLTRRECRFAHPNPNPPFTNTPFPFDVRLWGQLELPTLRECSFIYVTKSTGLIDATKTWPAGVWSTPNLAGSPTTVDFWTNDATQRFPDDYLTRGLKDANGNIIERIADDMILTNVIGFDVKAWDPGANNGLGAYVDMGNADTINPSPPAFFTGYGMAKSFLQGSPNTARIYDTWSTHYENAGLLGLNPAIYPPGRGVNGFDDPGLRDDGVTVEPVNGIVDDQYEKLTSPPYPAPLRGVQIKIRVFEPDSRQIREVTIVQDFLPK